MIPFVVVPWRHLEVTEYYHLEKNQYCSPRHRSLGFHSCLPFDTKETSSH